MVFNKIKCSNCAKELDKNDKIAILTEVKELKGITNLKSWAQMQKIICNDCYKKEV